MGPVDFSGVYYLAFIGMVAIVVSVIAAAIGLPLCIWWLVHHIQFV
jgi:hypothetical protein